MQGLTLASKLHVDEVKNNRKDRLTFFCLVFQVFLTLFFCGNSATAITCRAHLQIKNKIWQLMFVMKSVKIAAVQKKCFALESVELSYERYLSLWKTNDCSQNTTKPVLQRSWMLSVFLTGNSFFNACEFNKHYTMESQKNSFPFKPLTLSSVVLGRLCFLNLFWTSTTVCYGKCGKVWRALSL